MMKVTHRLDAYGEEEGVVVPYDEIEMDECQSCRLGYLCCKIFGIPPTPAEAGRLEVDPDWMQRGVARLRKRSDGACWYLGEDHRCTIYGARPIACREFCCIDDERVSWLWHTREDLATGKTVAEIEALIIDPALAGIRAQARARMEEEERTRTRERRCQVADPRPRVHPGTGEGDAGRRTEMKKQRYFQAFNPVVRRWTKWDRERGRMIETRKEKGPYPGIPKWRPTKTVQFIQEHEHATMVQLNLTKAEIDTLLHWGSTQDMLEGGFDAEDRAMCNKLRKLRKEIEKKGGKGNAS